MEVTLTLEVPVGGTGQDCFLRVGEASWLVRVIRDIRWWFPGLVYTYTFRYLASSVMQPHEHKVGR